MKHRNFGLFISQTEGVVVTFGRKEVERELQSGAAVKASEIVEIRTPVAVSFNIDRVAELYSEYLQEGEMAANLLDRITKDGAEIRVPLKGNKISPNYLAKYKQ